jgi:hypothetical protein
MKNKSRFLVFFAIAIFVMASCITIPTAPEAAVAPAPGGGGPEAAAVQQVLQQQQEQALQEFIDDGFRKIPVERRMLSANVFPWENPVGVSMIDHAWFVFDGRMDTLWDPYGDVTPGTIGLWLMVDFGEGNEQTVGLIRFMPRSHLPGRMSGAIFQGSNDSSTWTDLYRIVSTPPIGWNNIPINNDTAFRYYRYFTEMEGDFLQLELWARPEGAAAVEDEAEEE